MEINSRMSKRFAWLLGTLLLVFIALLVACGKNYSPTSQGLLVIPSQGSSVMQVFTFNLSTGSSSEISSTPPITGPPNQGSPTQVVIDPAGLNAYVVYSVQCNAQNLNGALLGAISTYSIKQDGTLAPEGSAIYLNGNPLYASANLPVPLPSSLTCGSAAISSNISGNAPTNIAMDSAGKYLFISKQATSLSYVYTDPVTNQPTVESTVLPGDISVFAIGSGATLTEVPGSPFSLPQTTSGNGGPQGDIASPFGIAVSPTVFPTQNSACSATPAPGNENVYVTDANNNQVFEFSVDQSSGALTPVSALAGQGGQGKPGTLTGTTPEGVAVDPCNRFVYVANAVSNNVSVYTICNGGTTQSINCPMTPNGSLFQITGSPVSAGNGPGPLAVDPLGDFLYVVDNLSSQISSYKLSQVNGTPTPLSPATLATGTNPVSIAIRGDNQWLFVTNNGSTSGNGSVSEYTITPTTGGLTPAGTGILTLTFPSGVAVK
jgi:DNA-binding beta-propeller fold protein YncE